MKPLSMILLLCFILSPGLVHSASTSTELPTETGQKKSHAQEASKAAATENDKRKTLKEIWSGFKSSCSQPMTDSYFPFLTFPLEICNSEGTCAQFKQKQPQVREALFKLHIAYLSARQARAKQGVPFVDDFGSGQSTPPKDGAEIIKGACVFRSGDSGWRIVKLDLRLLKDTF